MESCLFLQLKTTTFFEILIFDHILFKCVLFCMIGFFRGCECFVSIARLWKLKSEQFESKWNNLL